jgi:hypothetical protein
MTDPEFGKTQNAPPSFFARIPSRVIWETRRPKNKRGKGLTTGELHVFAVLCAYANNQGFAWPNSKTIGEVADTDRKDCTRVLGKCERLGYIEKVSKYRSHPKWRHVMGTVWRIVYDDRLEQEDLIDRMNVEDPAPVIEADLPLASTVIPESPPSNHEVEQGMDQLVVAEGEARWFVAQVGKMTGEVRLVNERSILAAAAAIQSGITPVELREQVADHLISCRDARRSAPHHLGFLLF